MAKGQALARFKERIQRGYFVRFHMSLILLGTMTSGILASKLLLLAGFHSMAWRYPVAVLLSYGVFLGLVRVWIGYVRSGASPGDPTGSLPDLGDVALDGAEVKLPSFRGGGGRSGGGGASDHWTSGNAPVAPLVSEPGSSSSGGGGIGDFSLGDIDGDGWILIVLFIVLIVAILGCGFYLIYIAPEVLSEAAFQLVLASSLRKVSRQMDATAWMGSVLKRTWFPMILVFGLTTAFGYYATQFCPQAGKLAEVGACLVEPSPASPGR